MAFFFVCDYTAMNVHQTTRSSRRLLSSVTPCCRVEASEQKGKLVCSCRWLKTAADVKCCEYSTSHNNSALQAPPLNFLKFGKYNPLSRDFRGG